jgi:hypothetical protein
MSNLLCSFDTYHCQSGTLLAGRDFRHFANNSHLISRPEPSQIPSQSVEGAFLSPQSWALHPLTGERSRNDYSLCRPARTCRFLISYLGLNDFSQIASRRPGCNSAGRRQYQLAKHQNHCCLPNPHPFFSFHKLLSATFYQPPVKTPISPYLFLSRTICRRD